MCESGYVNSGNYSGLCVTLILLKGRGRTDSRLPSDGY